MPIRYLKNLSTQLDYPYTKPLWVSNATVSTSGSTGALIVTGGTGIGGALNVTGNIAAGSINSTPIGATTASTGRFTTLTTTGGVTIGGDLTVTGSQIYIAGTTTVYTDSLIELHAPTGGIGETWTSSDGRDIGLRMHYYNAGDKNAAFVFDPPTQIFEFFSEGTETDGTFSGTYGTVKAATFIGNVQGNIDTATKLATARNIALTGDATGTASFDGSADASITVTLAASGVSSGSYSNPTINVDSKGRITSISSGAAGGVQSVNTKTGVVVLNTNDISEGTGGSPNLYFTTTRARDAISVSGSLAYSGGVISYTTPTTDGITEGTTNQYFTTTRARAAISVSGSLSYSSGVISYTTPNSDGITEGTTNQYFTTTRARAAISVSGSLSYSSGVISYTTPNSDGIAEGSSNQYFTNTRARNAISVTGSGSYDSATGVITITGGVTSVNTQTGAVTLTTSNINEGTNLYYTDTRVLTKINNTSIDALSDVNTTSVAPTNGQSLVWNGTNWVPGSASNVTLTVSTVAASGGGSLSYSSGTLTFAPAAIPTYTVSTAAASGSGSLSLSGTTFTFTPADLSSYLTSIGVVSANGFTGTSSGGTTPNLTITTSITGLLKGNGTALLAASGSDINSTFGSQTANYFYSAPDGTAGNPTFRAIAATDIPTLNQNTTGSAAKWTTARLLAGNSVDGSANVAFANKFIVQGTTDAGLTGAQFLGALSTGLLKNTTTTGALSVATAGTDYLAPPSGTSILKANNGGALSNVVASDINSTFGSQTANYFYAAPNGSAGTPDFRALVAADLPSTASTITSIGGTNTALTLGTSTAAATTVTVGGAFSGNTLKLAGTTGGTVNLTTDVTTGTANIFTSTQNITIGAATGTTTVGNNLTVTGNLTVSGTTTTVNSTTLAVTDLNITVGKNATTNAEADGAGLTVAGSNATFTYTSADDRWNLNKNLNVTTVYGALSGNATTATTLQTARNIAGVSFNGSANIDLSTANITENASYLYYTDARVLTKINATSIDALSDVDTTTAAPASGQALVWNNATSKWVPGTVAGNSVSLSVTTNAASGGGSLSYSSGTLTFTPASVPTYTVSTASASGGGSLSLSGSTFTFTPASIPTYSVNVNSASGGGNLTLSSTTFTFTPASVPTYTVSTAAASGGGSLSLSGSTFTFTPASFTGYLNGSSSIDALSDVNTTTAAPTNGQALVWNSTSSQWVPGTVAANISSYSIDALNDVDTTTAAPSNGQALVWNSSVSQWKPGTVASGIGTYSIDALNDVDTTTAAPTNGQALVWNSTSSQWVPGTVAGGGGSSVTVAETAPSYPATGNLWFNSTVGQLLIYYDSYWVQPTAPEGSSTTGSGSGSSSVTVSENTPSTGNTGDLWYKASTSALYVRYNNSWESINDTESVSAVTTTTVYTYNSTKYRTAKLVCQAVNGTSIEACELLVTHDGTSVYLTEYGNITSSSSTPVIVYDASLSSGTVSVTVSNLGSYSISVAALLLL